MKNFKICKNSCSKFNLKIPLLTLVNLYKIIKKFKLFQEKEKNKTKNLKFKILDFN